MALLYGRNEHLPSIKVFSSRPCFSHWSQQSFCAGWVRTAWNVCAYKLVIQLPFAYAKQRLVYTNLFLGKFVSGLQAFAWKFTLLLLLAAVLIKFQVSFHEAKRIVLKNKLLPLLLFFLLVVVIWFSIMSQMNGSSSTFSFKLREQSSNHFNLLHVALIKSKS